MKEYFLRPNGELVTLKEIARLGIRYIEEDPGAEYEITVGSDSQNFSKTKIVTVIAFCRKGKGGIFFYNVEYVKRIDNLRLKIYYETQESLELADALLSALDINTSKYNIHFQIHCDVGRNGATNALVQEIVGWVHSLGYDCCIKPESYAASAVANRFSK